MGWKILLPQELKKDARDLLESHGHTLIDGRGFETEDVITTSGGGQIGGGDEGFGD